MNYGQRNVGFQWDIDALYCYIASLLKEFCTRQSRAHFKARETGQAGSGFAGIQQQSANALARPLGMNKERANFCGVFCRIKQVVAALSPAAPAIQCFAFPPPAARNDDWALARIQGDCLNQQIRLVGDELTIYAEYRSERAVNLRRRVIVGLQPAHGRIDQLAQHGDVRADGRPNCESWWHWSEFYSKIKNGPLGAALGNETMPVLFCRHLGQEGLHLFGMWTAGFKLKIFVAGGFGVIKLLGVELDATEVIAE